MLKEAIYIATGKQFGTIPFSENVKVCRNVAADGMVLLKNNGILPIKPQKVALFGAGAIDTTICGTGSGYAFSPYKITVEKGLENAGFNITSEAWLKKYRSAAKAAEKSKKLSIIDKRWSGITIEVTPPAITDEDIRACRDTELAIYVITRNTGENFDRSADKGDYYLSEAEKQNLIKIVSVFKKTIVVLNTCVIDCCELDKIEGIDSIILMGQAGMEAGNALADVLTGKVCPSGRLTDTWAMDYSDYPASKIFSHNDGDTLTENYEEDIYVGYRYFDSMDKKVKYPFGYGLSYTSFEMSCVSATADWNNINLDICVKNNGKVQGKEVVQIYASAPEGKINKPWQELKAYGKTKNLKPGESEILHLSIKTETLASYDEMVEAWVMEPGKYLLRLGDHSRNTKVIAEISLDSKAVTRQVRNELGPDFEINKLYLEALKAPSLLFDSQSTECTINEKAPFLLSLTGNICNTIQNASQIERKVITYIPEGKNAELPVRNWKFPVDLKEEVKIVKNCPEATLPDVKEGKVTVEEFVASLDEETLMRIVTGVGKETPYKVPVRKPGMKKNKIAVAASGKTTAQYAESLGIPQMALCDGPAGLHLMGSNCAAFPVGMVTAQTWDANLAYIVGDSYANELEEYKVHIALGPGMNIHRDPLCGRNFEYYSEDPLLTGKTAVSFTKGIQEKHPHCGVALKHFACNNQELDRITGSSNVSERALREIYLKGFEICVREAKPKTVMSSYNCINNTHTSSFYELLTDVLRGEWGFDGMVMTDWDSQSDKPYDLHAGNDIIMGGYSTELLGGALYGAGPEFDADGAVFEREVKAYGGFFKNKITKWNSFVPDANGTDNVSTTVAAGVTLSDRVEDAVKAGYAEVKKNEDGSTTVTYRGINRGAWLPLGDLQKCAINVLKLLMSVVYTE